jgi:hypothetical protein
VNCSFVRTQDGELIPRDVPDARLDLATFSPLTPVSANAIGFWASTSALPLDPSLVGVQGALQIALFGTAGRLGIDLSNGLIAHPVTYSPKQARICAGVRTTPVPTAQAAAVATYQSRSDGRIQPAANAASAAAVTSWT